MRVNRIWLIAALVLIASAYYEARLKPQSRPLYESALNSYRQGNHDLSLLELERAYVIEPNSTAILVLMGWNQLKLRRYDAARENFGRAARLDPGLVEAKLGLVYLGIESGQTPVRLEDIRTLLEQEPRNRDYQLAAATMLRQVGQTREAAALFYRMLGRDRYGVLARKNLEEMYGLERLNEEIPRGLAPLSRPSELQVNFRATGPYFQRRSGNAWENVYLHGVNLGPAVPGKTVSEPPVLVEEYLAWFEQIAALGANTVRASTLLPPAFYRALRRHNENSPQSRLYLIQQVWLAEPAPLDLFQPGFQAVSRQELAWALDVIHGQGELPVRRGHADGLYAVDVSEYVLGLLIGRDWEPHIVSANNQTNPQRSSYAGNYVSIIQGNATEAWLAGLLDYAASYEVQKYNQQRPLGIVNWAALDPLAHPTEANLLEEFPFRRRLGERLTPPGPEEVIDDNDAVSVDETRFQSSPELPAGLFASYSVFPFYPDFLYREAGYLAVRDAEGPNPFLGYLKALKAHYRQMPLLASGYGISTSIGIGRFHPYGWNHGGLTESEQGAGLARMTRNLAEAGWAGGLISEWQDQWYRASWLTRPLAIPPERQLLWNNRLDPDQGFGLWTYDPAGEAQFFSSFTGWNAAPPLYVKDRGPAQSLPDGWDAERTLRSLKVSSDAAFVYLRLEVGKVRADRRNFPDFRQAQFLIGISTAPGRFGSRVQPGLAPQVRAESGANFLLHIGEGGTARLLIASNYNPREVKPISGLPVNVQLSYRIPFRPQLEEWSGFEEILVETNRRRFARDGRQFPPQRYSLSQLRYRPAGQSDDTLATWTCDFAGNALVFRLPWAALFFTDPSSRQVLAGTEGGPRFVAAETSGLQFFAVSFRPGDPVEFGMFPLGGVPASDSLPALDERGSFQGLKTYGWPKWDSISSKGRWKAGYTSVQSAFREVGGRTR